MVFAGWRRVSRTWNAVTFLEAAGVLHLIERDDHGARFERRAATKDADHVEGGSLNLERVADMLFEAVCQQFSEDDLGLSVAGTPASGH